MSNILRTLRAYVYFLGLFAVLLTAHLLHSNALWEPEVFPLAAALQLKRGAALYRDVWFDKPPLSAWIYLLWGAAHGPALRVAGAIYDLVACALACHLAQALWTRREGHLAAGLLAFYLTFDTHAAVLPLGADLLLLVPHLAAILFAVRRQPLYAGIAAGTGFLVNAKGLFVLAAAMPFLWPNILPLAAGFAIPCAVAAAILGATGSLAAWYVQAWQWPALYAASPIVTDPVSNGLQRTANWLGFHAALVIGSVCYYLRSRTVQHPHDTLPPHDTLHPHDTLPSTPTLLLWTTLTFAGVILGYRFFPRYYFLLLPALLIPAARGLGTARKPLVALALLSLAIPAIRFGPRYLHVATTPDLALDRDSRQAARLAQSLAPPNGTLYIWGYRPEIYVYSGLRPATRYLDSQALTGVPADRHLTQSTVVLTEGTQAARTELASAHPDILIDGLTPFNPHLAMDHYAELRPWLTQYREVARTKGTIIYRRNIK